MLPSSPAVIPIGKLKVGVRNSVITPSGVIRATWLRFCSVNQKLPSGPRVIEIGWLSELGIGKDRCRSASGTAPSIWASVAEAQRIPVRLATAKRNVEILDWLIITTNYSPFWGAKPRKGCQVVTFRRPILLLQISETGAFQRLYHHSLVICLRSVFICAQRVKVRTIVKWAIGAVALVVLIAVCGVVWLFVAFYMDMEKGERHRRQFQTELDSGRWDFGDQTALFAVAQGIVKNDPEAIRSAAKAVPDLQAPGRDGTTLLNFAVRQSWQRAESVESIRTLLSLGVDPNYTNGTA